ncbi:MAG: hypothetical protein WBD64_03735 [Candidatus Zixiibacteriota bacterium]
MKGGFVGALEHFPDGYRCYIIFLPNETDIRTDAEKFVMDNFWHAASSTDDDVLFSGVIHGEGLREARRTFQVQKMDEGYFLILDTQPASWDSSNDPVVKIPLNELKNGYDVRVLMLTLLSISREDNFIGKLKRKQTFKRANEILSRLPIFDLIKIFIPKP